MNRVVYTVRVCVCVLKVRPPVCWTVKYFPVSGRVKVLRFCNIKLHSLHYGIITVDLFANLFSKYGDWLRIVTSTTQNILHKPAKTNQATTFNSSCKFFYLLDPDLFLKWQPCTSQSADVPLFGFLLKAFGQCRMKMKPKGSRVRSGRITQWNWGTLWVSFDALVNKVVQSCFVQLRHLSKIRSFLSSADLEKVIHAFINCNALHSGVSRQNTSPIISALHWLPVSKWTIMY